MKVAPSYISRETLIKKAAQRSKERIAEHIKVSSAYKPEEVKIINENLDPIARYAHKQNIDYIFSPSPDEIGKTRMEVYKRQLKAIDTYDGSKPVMLTLQEYAGEAVLSNNMNDKKKFLDAIKTESAKILYGKK